MAIEKAKHLVLKCLGQSEEMIEQNKVNARIEKELRRDQSLESKSMKLLLLGTGESGKSTFIKQMRIIHGDGYSLLEKQKYASIIIQNILISMQTLIKAMQEFEIPYANEENENNAKFIQDADTYQIVTPGTGFRSLQSYQTMLIIKEFWKDTSVQECFKRQKDYHISDSIAYFLTHIDRINQHDYVPTEQVFSAECPPRE